MDHLVHNMTQLEVGKSYHMGGAEFCYGLQEGFCGKVLELDAETGVAVVGTDSGIRQFIAGSYLRKGSQWIQLPQPAQYVNKVYREGVYCRLNKGYELHDE